MSNLAYASQTSPDALENAQRESFGRLGRKFIRILSCTGVALLFLISPMLMYDWGINYGSASGNAIEKVHPGTWLILLTLVLRAAGRGNPLTLLDEIFRYYTIALYIGAWIALTIFSIAFRGIPFTPWIDTFLLPALLYLLIEGMSDQDKKSVARVIHLVLAMNALLGLYEYLSGYRFTTYVAGEFLIDTDWRATALLGHPLANALATGTYVLIMGLGGGRDLPKFTRLPIIALQLVAMIAFGGRTSLVVTVFLLGCISMANIVRVLLGRRFDIVQVGFAILIFPFVLAAIAYAASTGFFDPMIQRFVDDNGSANARVIMFRLFDYLSWRDIVWGPDPALISSLQHTEGIEYGIESFWVAFILMQGLAMALIFFLALGGFSWRLMAATRPATAVLLFFFFFLASTSVSLSAKTCAFAMFTVMTLSMMRAAPSEHRRTMRQQREFSEPVNPEFSLRRRASRHHD